MADRFHSKESAVRMGRLIREARRRKGKTLQSLAIEANVHHGQISRIERGHMIMATCNVQKICTLLGVDLSLGVSESSNSDLGLKIDALLIMHPATREPISRLVTALEDLLKL